MQTPDFIKKILLGAALIAPGMAEAQPPAAGPGTKETRGTESHKGTLARTYDAAIANSDIVTVGDGHHYEQSMQDFLDEGRKALFRAEGKKLLSLEVEEKYQTAINTFLKSGKEDDLPEVFRDRESAGGLDEIYSVARKNIINTIHETRKAIENGQQVTLLLMDNQAPMAELEKRQDDEYLKALRDKKPQGELDEMRKSHAKEWLEKRLEVNATWVERFHTEFERGKYDIGMMQGGEGHFDREHDVNEMLKKSKSGKEYRVTHISHAMDQKAIPGIFRREDLPEKSPLRKKGGGDVVINVPIFASPASLERDVLPLPEATREKLLEPTEKVAKAFAKVGHEMLSAMDFSDKETPDEKKLASQFYAVSGRIRAWDFKGAVKALQELEVTIGKFEKGESKFGLFDKEYVGKLKQDVVEPNRAAILSFERTTAPLLEKSGGPPMP